MNWQPIETAPKDGSSILALCAHDSDKYVLEEDGKILTEYGAACEHWSHVPDGVHVIHRVPESSDGDWESGYYHVPGYWVLSGSEDMCANPTHWMPLPDAPGNGK